MNHIVFVLGAGASVQAGAPLMYNFIDVAQNLYATRQVEEHKADFERVFKSISALHKVHSKADLDLINIESIFTTLEMANILKKLRGFKSEEIPEVIASLKKVIMVTLERTISYPSDGYSSYKAPAPYPAFVELIKDLTSKGIPKNKVSIITFNYDIALDYAFYKAGIKPRYGLQDETEGHISFYKLHGSLNWGECERTGKTIPLYLYDYFKNYRISAYDSSRPVFIPIGSQLKDALNTFGHFVKKEPVIVPPTFNKGSYQKILESVWGEAAKDLENADQLFVIGYSLPDTDGLFPLLYALGTEGETRLNKVHIHNPDPNVQERFYKMLGVSAKQRFRFFGQGFQEAIGGIRSLYKFEKESSY